MSPSYRSGIISDTQECHACKRAMPSRIVETCFVCGRKTCTDCLDDHLITPACQVCREQIADSEPVSWSYW